MPVATFNGVSIRYTLQGEGEPVLLIMGLAVGLEGWKLQIEDLSRDYRVCAFDNRGVGGSAAPSGAWSMRDLARDALALLDHLGWDQAHVVGISMGGMIAQELALQARARVKTLSLLATHAGGWPSRPTRTAVAGVVGANLSGSRRVRLAALRRMLYSEQYLREAGRDSVYQLLRENLLENPATPAGLAGQLSAVVRHRSLRRLSDLRALPSLVITGTADRMVRPENSRRIAAALGAELVEIPGAGHAVNVERVAEVNAALRRHFHGKSAGSL